MPNRSEMLFLVIVVVLIFGPKGFGRAAHLLDTAWRRLRGRR